MYKLDKLAKQQYMIHLKQFEHTKIGDLINTCTGLNGRIIIAEPGYITVAGGQLLLNIDLETSVGNCSFRHCGIQLPKTKEEMEAAIREYLRHPEAAIWNWDIRYSPEVTTINNDGTVIINYDLERQLLDARNESVRKR
jgi:hypothetical protein